MTMMILGGLGIVAGIAAHVWGCLSFNPGPMIAGLAISLVSAGLAIGGLARAIFG